MPNDTRIDIRVPEEERKLFFEAAEAAKLPMSLWARGVLRAAAEKIIEKAKATKKGR